MSSLSLSRRPPHPQADVLFQLFNAKGRRLAMQHGMAIRTDRSQVADRVNFVFLTHFGQRDNVMHMNVVSSEFAVCGLE
jgi:hypothetical protein